MLLFIYKKIPLCRVFFRRLVDIFLFVVIYVEEVTL